MDFLTLVVVLFLFFLLYRYFGWGVSYFLARCFGCSSVRLGKCGFFYISHIKLCLRNGIVIEVDDLKLSSAIFSSAFTKPLLLSAGDIRIEGNRSMLTKTTSSRKHIEFRLSSGLQRFVHWLQYTGVFIRTARMVFLDVIPGCLLHSTFESFQLDTFRDREGVQLEFVCRLAQAKLFERASVQYTSALYEVTLGGTLSLDFSITDKNLKRIGISIANPLFSISDGLLKCLGSSTFKKSSETSSLQRTNLLNKASSNRLMFTEELPNVKLDITNFTLCYIANLGESRSEKRTLSTTLSCISASIESGSRFSMALANLNVIDLSPRSNFKCTDFVINFNKTNSEAKSLIVSFDVRVFNPWCAVCLNDLAFWTCYVKQTQKLMTESGDCFDDNFDAMEPLSGVGDSEKHITPYIICISAEVNGLQCCLMPNDGCDIDIGIDLVTFTSANNFLTAELGVEYLLVRYGGPKEEQTCFSFERHVWGTAIALCAGLAQYCGTPGRRRLMVELDEGHVEYADKFAQQMAQFVGVLFSPDTPGTSRSDSWSPSPHSSVISNEFVVQVSAEKFAVFLVARQASFAVVAMEHVRLESAHNPVTISLAIEKLQLGTGSVSTADFICPDGIGAQEKFGGSDKVVIGFSSTPTVSDFMIRAEAPVSLVWDPLLHIILLETYRSIKEVRSTCFPGNVPENTVSKAHRLRMESQKPVTFEFRLPRNHIMKWEVLSLLIQRNGHISFVFPNFVVRMDDNPILTLENFKVWRRSIDARMDLGRAEFQNLADRTNKVWAWCAETVSFLFPYGYDFAACFDEVINSWKWIKLVHGMKPKPFSVDSPLPSDLSFCVKNAVFQINDDPFEVQLQSNYELMVDEVYECERRRQILDQKLEELRKQHPLLSQTKVDELHRSLTERNAEIYIERSKKSPPVRSHLVLWTVSNLEIHAYADRTLHGKENCVKLMRLFNPEAPFPAEGMEFSTLWARAVEFDFDEWKVQFRDYSMPYMYMKDGHFWGRLVGAEHYAGNRSIRNCLVSLCEPWGDYVVNRNMCPIKFYYDIECEIEKLSGIYGPCWEPCLSMISLCWNNISAPSRDPSVPLPVWDKIRLLFHGRLSMLCKQLITSLLASTDPYNSTELMEISWENFEFDWTSGQFLVQTDVSAFARTASKYDDSRMLQLPGFKCSVLLNWVCIGDPHDHHSALPYAPDKLPEYSSTNHEHDSYISFRSTYVDLNVNFEAKPPGEPAAYSQYPQILLYANTFRWLDFLKNTITTVNRPIKRGPLFGSKQWRKLQLSRHFRHIRVDLTLPKFLISYWMSFSSSHGFRMISESLHLLSSLELQLVQNESSSQDGVVRRRTSKWSVSYVSADLSVVQLHLFGDSSKPESDMFNVRDDADSFFLGLHRLTYTREPTQEQRVYSATMSSDTNENGNAVHRLAIHDLRASWTPENRDTCLAITDGIQRAHMLRKILSNDALKIVNFVDNGNTAAGSRCTTISGQRNSSTRVTNDNERSPGRSRFGSDGRIPDQSDMLQKLIDEAGTKLVAFSEEAKDLPSDMLHGIALCSADDVFLTNWQIDLMNSQVVLHGKESDGFILLTATRASVTQRVHLPVWKRSQLLAKRSWCAVLSGMQYFAPLVLTSHSACSSPAMERKKKNFRWLPRDVIEEKACSDPNISDRLDNFINTGEAVGGVVADQASSLQSENKSQLQRVVSRCSCQMYFCYFSDTLDLDTENMPLPIDNVEKTEKKWGQREPVDCFTLKHNMLEVSTNPAQYEMAMNIINHLVLFVDPRKKELEGRRQRLRFENQLKTVDEVKCSITNMQADLRDIIANIRMLDRRSFFLNRQLEENSNDYAASEANRELAVEIERLKKEQLTLTDELAMTISYYKEKQVERLRQLVDFAEDEHALVARRFEVCFEDCIWRLTESDGQIALAEIQIRNFLYTRTARIDNSGEHLLEIGTVKVTNLLPDSVYKHTLQVQSKYMSQDKEERQLSIRLICRDMAPVGGICVKEHFEVNVSPMVAQITYRFFEKIMAYFFPGRNIDKEDQQILDVSDEQQMAQGLSVRQWIRDAVNGSFRRPTETNRSRDDIDRMKERAQKNNVFLYIKIPEVPFIVSYKGNKDKNLGDVDRFQFLFPLCEYHDKNWTWLDLALAVKQRCRRVLIQQYMKQKLLRNRLTGPEGKAAEVDEEEKKRIVLGSAIVPDKEKKKTKKNV